MNVHTAERLIPGPVGNIDVSVDLPDAAPRGLALVGHPHPLFGGTKDNKVAQTLARTFVGLGYATVRPNFRGVGKTEGTHDNGIGEQDDMLAVLDWMRTQAEWSPEVATLPLALGGFSFGSFVVSQVARRLAEAGTPANAWRWSAPPPRAGMWRRCPRTPSSSTASWTTRCRLPPCSTGRDRRNCR